MTFKPGIPRVYLHRRLTPDQEDRIRAAAAEHVPMRELEHCYDVSRRTLYRVLERQRRETTVLELAGYRATFEIGPEGSPVQVTPWVPA